MGVLTLTSRCGLDCVMCLEPTDVPRGLDLPRPQALRLARLFSGRVPAVWTCAGESLLYPGFYAVARELSRRGTPVGVGTNGLALAEPGVLGRCSEAGVKWLHISCPTSRPARFARLCGRGSPDPFRTFLRGLERVDAWNRGRGPARRFEVILQLVLMKGFREEAAAYFKFVRERLAHSPLILRVEPMQFQGRGAAHPELAMDIDELAEAVAAIIARRPKRAGLEFKSVPLCLLAGREGLSEDLRRLASGAFRVGNMSCRSAQLQLVCSIGDPSRSPQAAACRRCSLAPLCPGVLDVPVPPNSSWPRPSSVRPETVLERAGLGPGYLRRESAPAYPGDSGAPRVQPEEPREEPAAAHPPIPLLAMNAALPALPHDAAVRRAMELLCSGSPIIRTGSACDLACTYCCVGADGPALQPEVSLRRLVDGLRALGYRGIGYMGGEPTLHPGFLGVVRHAAARGFRRQMLCTNGIRLADPGFAASLFKTGIDAVTTSLDAFDARVQEPLYGGRAVHGRALAGLRHALAAPGVEVLLSAVVTARNARHLPRYMEETARLQRRFRKPIGVMLCVLQKPARRGPAQRALALPLPAAARLVGKALARARALGVAAFTFGFPPCLLPDRERAVSELYASEWVVAPGTTAVERSRLHDAATYWAGCAACPQAGHCPGVMRQYADAATATAVAAGLARSLRR
jgi:MoaA/NifB/PqqE/SkfB family radical SAM enzyme